MGASLLALAKFIYYTSFITISQHLGFKVKIQNDLTLLRFAARHCSIAQLFDGSYQLYVAICCTFQIMQRETFSLKKKTTYYV